MAARPRFHAKPGPFEHPVVGPSEFAARRFGGVDEPQFNPGRVAGRRSRGQNPRVQDFEVPVPPPFWMWARPVRLRGDDRRREVDVLQPPLFGENPPSGFSRSLELP